MSHRKRCRAEGCQTLVLFAVDANDPEKIHPIDTKAPIFQLIGDEKHGYVAKRMTPGTVGVSHFATCRGASQFSRSKRKEE